MAYTRWSSSDWYIYWSSESGRTLATQQVAVWSRRGVANQSPPRNMTYPEVRFALQAGDFAMIRSLNKLQRIHQKGTLRRCLEEWAEHVADKFGPVLAATSPEGGE